MFNSNKLLSFTTLIALSFAGAQAASSSAHAFSLSAAGALNFSNVNISPNPSLVTTSPGFAVGFGGLASMEAFTGFDVELGLLYIPRKVNTTAVGINGAVTANTLQIPLLLRFTAIPVISVGAGVYYAATLGDLTVSLPGQVDLHPKPSAAGYGTSDFGLVGSIAGKFPVLPTMSIFADARFLLGLTDVDNVGGVSTQYRDFQILAGLSFGI